MPKTRVVIINGVAESGKDTFVEYVSQYCQMDDSANVLNLSSVGPIKDMLMGFGWDGDKIFKVRDCISSIKDIWIGANNGPTMYLLNNILEFHKCHFDEDNIIFCHIRERAEIDKLSKILSGMDILGIEYMIMYVKRSQDNITSRISKDMASFNDADTFYYDIIIDNDETLSDLETKAIDFTDELLGGNYDEV